MEKKYTICLWPGMGYWLFPFEVLAYHEEEALTKAVERAQNEDYGILGFKSDDEKEMKSLLEYYEKERKEYEDDHEFITNYLNYTFLGDINYYLNMENTRIEEGWNRYPNSIPLPEGEGEGTYSIVRFFKKAGKTRKVIKRGLSLKEAQEHCSDPNTSTSEWFEGYEKE
ncbi:MAG: hypothetical protein EOM19_02080 [Candidatus Moranbacteria bacterium]|nr:hypothetical protein [Candidatus Moranbacteria bacterium]